jgi:hypothetical protein
MLIIVVNAGTQGPIKIDNKQSEPKLLGVIGGVIGAPMDNYSFDSIQLTLSTIKEIRGLDTTYYPVLISFPLIPDKDKSLRDTVNGIGTNFGALSAAQIDALKQASDLLLHQDPCFQQFQHDDDPGKHTAPSAICGSVPPPR